MNKEQRNHLYETAERQDDLQAQLDKWKIQLRRAQETKTCMPRPIGCGQTARTFRDDLSKHEYKISALCQDCQDAIFEE